MQRQLRLGDILDDYCPRERRLTNHAIVAMIGETVKQTRCVTCDTEHEYKHAKVPRQRHKETPAALQAQVLASGPKRVGPESTARGSDRADVPVVETGPDESAPPSLDAVRRALAMPGAYSADSSAGRPGSQGRHTAAAVPKVGLDAEPETEDEGSGDAAPIAKGPESEGPAHRRLIRATLPRLEGQAPASRPAPDFTIRTPAGGRPQRFRPRQQRGSGPSFSGDRQAPSGNAARGGPSRGGNSRPPQASRQSRRFDGRKRSK